MTDGTVLALIPSPAQGVWHLGPVPIRAYAFCIIVGIIVAVWWGSRRWQARGGQPGEVIDVALWAVPFGLIGGRLYHVLTDWDRYFGPGGKGLGAAFRVWDGGLGIWGAVALGAVGAWIGARNMGIKLPAFGDAIAPPILLAQAIGRFGNYFNQELFGRPTDVPWGLEIFVRDDGVHAPSWTLIDGVSTGEVYSVVHPTFLYEMVWNILIVIALVLIDRYFRIGHGRLFAMYVAGYCIGRFGVELMRDDFATHIFGVRINVFTSAIVFLCAALYVVMAPKGREQGLSMYWPDRAEELAAEGAVGYISPELDDETVDGDEEQADEEYDEDYGDEPDDSEDFEDFDDEVVEDDESTPAPEIAAAGGATATAAALVATESDADPDSDSDSEEQTETDEVAADEIGGDAAEDDQTAEAEEVEEVVEEDDAVEKPAVVEPADEQDAPVEEDAAAEEAAVEEPAEQEPVEEGLGEDDAESAAVPVAAPATDEAAEAEDDAPDEQPEAPAEEPRGRVIPGREPSIVDSVSSQGYTVVPADDEELGGISIVEENPGGSAGSIEIRRSESTNSAEPESSDESRSAEVADEGDTPEEDR